MDAVFNHKYRPFYEEKSIKDLNFREIYQIIWRCGGSLVVLQNTEALVPGSNPASLTVINSEERQNHSVYTEQILKTAP